MQILAQPGRGCVTAGDRLFPTPPRCGIASKKRENFPLRTHPAGGNRDARGGDELPTVTSSLCHPSGAASCPAIPAFGMVPGIHKSPGSAWIVPLAPSQPAPAGVGLRGYAGNAPNVSGLDCERSG